MAPGNYTVYFDFDKAVINAAGQQVINQVLADDARGEPRILEELDHLLGTSARSSEMSCM